MIAFSATRRSFMVHPTQQRPAPTLRRPHSSIAFTSSGRTRTLRIHPLAACLTLSGVALFLAAYVAATGYLIYRDDLIRSAVTERAELQYAYEERIAALRKELDRITSRHVVQTLGVEDQLAILLERQMLIERRSAALDELMAKARDAGIEIEIGDAEDAAVEARSANRDVEPLLTHVQSSLDDADAEQANTLDQLSAAADGEIGRLSAALTPLGIKLGEDDESEPQGGPFIAADGLYFVERAALAGRTIDAIAEMRRSAEALPLGVPVKAERLSSKFGYRLDPFLHREAFHAGVDFVADQGTEVHATAPGTVVSAGWHGGYGKLIEIHHADGVTTRYGHLSNILVSPGDVVAAGETIGRVGSTGRSTGPHLHYETRRSGEPVNPSIYISAGRILRGSQS